MKPKPSIDRIRKVVAEYYDVSVSDIMSKSRSAQVSKARRVAVYMARRITNHSSVELARRFGREHSTILYYAREIAELVDTDAAARLEVDELIGALASNMAGDQDPDLLRRPGSDWNTLSFAYMRSVNMARCRFLHDRDGTPMDSWTLSDWGVAVAGEAGETSEALAAYFNALLLANHMNARTGKACDLAKKVKRLEGPYHNKPGDTDRGQLLERLADEFADMVLYADLLCGTLGIDLAEAVVRKFNAKSEELGTTHRMYLTGDRP